MRTQGSSTDGNRQPNPVAAADITKAATSPGRSAALVTHISWDLSNPLHRLRRPGGPPAASPTTRASRRTSMTRSPRCWPTGPPATPRGRRYTALPSSSRTSACVLARVGATSHTAA